VAQFRLLPEASASLRRELKKPGTRWLCWQSAANRSPLVKFPDHWENRGNFVNVGPIACLAPRTTIDWRWNSLVDRTGNLLRKQGASRLKWEIRTSAPTRRADLTSSSADFSLDAISCHTPRRESLLPLERALWREARGLSLCVHDVPLSRDVRPHDAWPLPRGVWRRACNVLMPSCDVPKLSTWNFLQRNRVLAI
jgi:hypothetical protein